MNEWWTRKGKQSRADEKRFIIALKRAKKASTVCCYFLLPIKVNSIIKASLTNADNYVNGTALMLTDDSNVLLISQLMEHFLIECLFLHVSETRQMDALSICMAFSSARGRVFLGAKTQLGKCYFFSSGPGRRNTNAIASRSLQFLEGFPCFEVFWLPQQFISCLTASFTVENFCKAFTYRVFHRQSLHFNLINLPFKRHAVSNERVIAIYTFVICFCSCRSYQNLLYQLIPFRYLRCLIGRHAAVFGGNS